MKQIRFGQPQVFGAYTLTPVEQAAIHVQKRLRGVWAWVSLEPLALLVDSPQGRVMLNLDGVPIPPDNWPIFP